MAEAAVGSVINTLIPLPTEETRLLIGIHKDVKEIKDELELIMPFLKDADSKAEAEASYDISDGVKMWVEEVREVAFQITDIIDEYTHFIAQQQRPHKRKFINSLSIVTRFLELKQHRDIASKIEELKKKIRGIKQNTARYALNATQQGSPLIGRQTSGRFDPRTTSLFLDETEVVDIESVRDELIGVLKRESSQRLVISVVGMGGLGKTTLVRQVYDHVKGSFDCYAWITVSQTYNQVELLKHLMVLFYQANRDSVREGIDGMNEVKIINNLRDYLQGKSYVVVFDDVWNRSFWADVEHALPNSRKSGVFITTRDIQVANFCKSSARVHIHQLQRLPHEKAWELFCRKAFPFGQCPIELNELSHAIVEKCEGLPLAIVAVAGILSTKEKTANEWGRFNASLSSELENDVRLTSTTKMLSLSYNDLPYYLKSCFLCFGIFPKDYSIRSRRLIRLWVAEGFVNSRRDEALQKVAEEYLNELINRSLVQVTEIDFDGKPRGCRIYDLLREIILKKMEDLSFCQVLSGEDSTFRRLLTRRVSLVNGAFHGIIKKSNLESSHVRSMFIFNKDEMPNHMVREIVVKFKLLKVLDFEDAPGLTHLPTEIGNLFHLKSLILRGTKVKVLPKSIGKLENLETLDLKLSLVYELPAEINRLHKLQNLLAYSLSLGNERAWKFNTRRGVKIGEGIGKLEALQKLHFIEACVAEVDLFEELNHLTKLRKLGVSKLRREDGRALCGCIENMKQLESLSICSTSEDETIDLEYMSSPPQFLQRLCIRGRLRNLPRWIPQLQSLVRIQIFWSKLEDDSLKALQNLCNLLELRINYDGYYGEKLHFEEGAFRKLKVLNLRSLSGLKSLVRDEGALVDLEHFELGPSPQLMELQFGFQNLRNLTHVSFYEMPTKFFMSYSFQSLHTVPDVSLYHTIDGKLTGFKLESVMEILEYMREHDKLEWESLDFGEIASNWNEPGGSSSGSSSPEF